MEEAAAKQVPAGNLLTLASPAGWLIEASVFNLELISTSFLSLISPFSSLLAESQAFPSNLVKRVGSLLRRITFGFVGAVYVFAILVTVLIVSLLIGVAVVRVWVDEPISMREVIYFDYTQKEPTAIVVLGGSSAFKRIRPGHSINVMLDVILPESEYNRRLGIFQVTAGAVSSKEEIIAASSQPYMLHFSSLPIQLMRTFFMGLPLLFGFCSETQKLSIPILCYTESKYRTNLIMVKLKPRAGTTDLPQIYTSEVKINTQLPWMKQMVYNWKLTLYVWTTFYVYGFLMIVILCYLKPNALGVVWRQPSEGPAELERETRYEGDREEREELAERLKKWRERVNKRRGRIEQRRVVSHELAEGEGSTAEGEVIDDSGDFAPSVSSDCTY
ncbi:hypothetical protein LUZ60_008025 [Juncus effusus]|nr:hypothetical protein LUZ60_008025 [Juncus effusus]